VDADRRQAFLESAEIVGQIGSWEWIPATDALTWSDNLYRIFGYEPREIEPTLELVLDQIHPDDRERVQRSVETLREAGEPDPIDYRVVIPGRSVRHLRSKLAVVEEREGKPWRLVGSVQDVTDQRRVEREIAARVAASRALVEWESLEQGASRLLCELAEAIDFGAGTLWLPQDDALVAGAFWHSRMIDISEFESATRELRLQLGEGLPGRAWETREPTAWVDLGQNLSFLRRDAAAAVGLRSGVAFPALGPDGVLAVIELLSQEDAGFSERLVRSFTWIGYEVGHFLAGRRGELQPPPLSSREVEVLRVAALGRSSREIADELTISPTTVKTHFHHIYAKLGVSNRASAVALAVRLGLVD
jgi:PAS domain S-box-containing protein